MVWSTIPKPASIARARTACLTRTTSSELRTREFHSSRRPSAPSWPPMALRIKGSPLSTVDIRHGRKTSICQASHRAGARTRRIPKVLSMIYLQASGMPRAILHSERRLLNELLQRLVQRLATLVRERPASLCPSGRGAPLAAISGKRTFSRAYVCPARGEPGGHLCGQAARERDTSRRSTLTAPRREGAAKANPHREAKITAPM